MLEGIDWRIVIWAVLLLLIVPFYTHSLAAHEKTEWIVWSRLCYTYEFENGTIISGCEEPTIERGH